jgi:hypothetical protein
LNASTAPKDDLFGSAVKKVSIKSKPEGGIVCLETSAQDSVRNKHFRIRQALSDLCLSFQHGDTTLKNYREIINAATPLLLATEASGYFLSADMLENRKQYARLIELLRSIQGISGLCRLISQYKPADATVNRLCSDLTVL